MKNCKGWAMRVKEKCQIVEQMGLQPAMFGWQVQCNHYTSTIQSSKRHLKETKHMHLEITQLRLNLRWLIITIYKKTRDCLSPTKCKRCHTNAKTINISEHVTTEYIWFVIQMEIKAKLVNFFNNNHVILRSHDRYLYTENIPS